MTDIAFAFTLTDEQLDELAARVAKIVTIGNTETTPVTGRWLTPEDAARLIRCEAKRIYTLTSSGRLTRYHEGRRLLLDREEVERLVERG